MNRPNVRSGNRGLGGLLLALLIGVTTLSASPGDLHSQDRKELGGTEQGGTEASESRPVVGPSSGALILAGGGSLGPEIWGQFVSLAGGDDARIVVIPTAGAEDDFPEDWGGLEGLREAGAHNLTVLHTRDPEVADSEEFVSPLLEATGVWIPGGRQWRLVDAYLGTRTHQALFELLARGGVVGGTSAGASILASFLVRGDPNTNQVVISQDYLDGFGLLNGTAVDQHLLVRDREDDLWEVLELRPELLGIGLDEGTALVIQEDRGQVIGVSEVLVYDRTGPIPQTHLLREGEAFDLGQRTFAPTMVPQEAGHESSSTPRR